MASQPARTIVKASGERQPFDPSKVEQTCRRAGASPSLARETARYVASRVRGGSSTADILKFAERCLRVTAPRVALRYTLKEAMRRLGPAGFHFEKYVAEILRAYGYGAELPDLLPGMDIVHEVDVVARKDTITAMVECKYRNAPGIEVRLKDIMATWARFLDLREAAGNLPVSRSTPFPPHEVARPRPARGSGQRPTATVLGLGHRSEIVGAPVAFTECWIVTNTRITMDGLAFGNGKGMRCIGWRYPEDGGLARMIEDRHLYPITILRTVDATARERFAAAGLLLCHDVLAVDDAAIARQTGLPTAKVARIRAEITNVLRC